MDPEQQATPLRVLVISADIGEGHNATARAVEQRAREAWPSCQIRRVDTLRVMGRFFGPVARWSYRINVDRTPFLFDLFYRTLWRHRWLCDGLSGFFGRWSGPRLARLIATYDPDLVVSTYPFGSAGLNEIRRRGGLDVPVATIIPDFGVHPFWIYPEIDMHFVVSEASLRALRRVRPDARAAVGALPVVAEFGPAAKAPARRCLGLPPDRPVVLISGGAFGFGSVERAVAAALRAHREASVLVTCGHNEELLRRLAARGEPPERLLALGWTTKMPTLMAAADVVVTNGAGATSLEVLASGRAMLTFEPIAGHGKANAELIAGTGLAPLCRDEEALVAALTRLLHSPEALAEAERKAVTDFGHSDLRTEVAALPDLPRHRSTCPLPAADAFFVHATSAAVPQQVGAMLMLDLNHPLGPPERMVEHLAELVRTRTPTLPMLRRQLERRPGRWPRWRTVDEIDPARHITLRVVDPGDAGGWSDGVRDFFARPVPLDRPPWQVQVLRDATTGRTALLASVHHALGDGLAVTATLIGYFSDRPGPQPQPPAPPATPTDWRDRALRAGRGLRGLIGLAGTGSVSFRAAGARSTPQRSYGLIELPAAPVRATARAYGVSTTALLLALVGEALQLHGVDPADTRAGRLRMMVPRTIRAVRRAGDGGNYTAAVSLRLPVAAMPRSARIAEVSAALDRMERSGQPLAARSVVTALGFLPSPVHALAVRAIYRRQFFDLIGSVLPGPRRTHHVMGARVTTVFPLLPLAEGVGLGVGFLSWGETIGLGVTADPGLLPDAERFTDLLSRTADDLLGRPASPAGPAGRNGDASGGLVMPAEPPRRRPVTQ